MTQIWLCFLTLLVIFSATSSVYAQNLIPLEETSWLSRPVTILENVDGGPARMAAWGDNVYVAWEEINGIRFIKSSDGGKTFSQPILLAEPQPRESAVGKDPVVGVNADDVYILYSSGLDIFLLRSQDNGMSFSDLVNVSKTDIDSPYSVTNSVLSVSDNNVYVSWTVGSGPWSEIYFARSVDGGISFGTPSNISDTPNESSYFPIITSSGNNVYVVWYDVNDTSTVHHISFAASDDQGQTFRRTINLSGNTDYYNAFEPGLAAAGEDVYVVWREETTDGPSIILAKSSDSGRTFSFKEGMAPGGAWPVISVEGNNVYLEFGTQDVGYSWAFTSSLDGGKTFSEQIMLSNQSWGLKPRDELTLPKMVADGSTIFISWKYPSSDAADSEHDVFLVASYNEGRNFTKALDLSKDTRGDVIGNIAISATDIDRVLVLWQESTSSYPDTLLVEGKIPESYTEPFRQVSTMTPVEPNGFRLAAPSIIAITVSAGAAAGAIYYLKKWRRK